VEKSSKRTVRGLENMVKTICCSLAVMIMLIGCAEKNLKAPSPADYPESSFFQAEGIGQSEREAGNEALAEMARIFESEVFSDTYDRASSYIDAAGDETYRARIESNIRVVSAVKLEGVRIIRTWFDNEKGNYHALAVLDRYKAKEDWQNGIEDIDHRIEGEFEAADTKDGQLMRLLTYTKIIRYWVEREVLVSRLRVIGFQDATIRKYDIKKAFRMISQIKTDLLVYVRIGGDFGEEIESRLAESLNADGFVLGSRKSSADVLIIGDVTVVPVDLKNPEWEFARASVSLTVSDAVTGVAVREISENARAGHLNYNEAAYKAFQKVVEKVIKSVAEKLAE
jgi:hypothetical protein